MSTIVDESTSEATPAAPANLCPHCGSHVLFTVELTYGGNEGFRPDFFGVTPEVGDTVTRCGDCAAYWKDGPTAIAPAASTTTSTSDTPPLASDEDESVVAQLEAFFAGKLQELGDTLGARVQELEQQLVDANARADTAEQAAAAAAASTPPTPPPPVNDPAPPADASTPPAAAPVPDPPTPPEGS